jgi:hypothetical protein
LALTLALEESGEELSSLLFVLFGWSEAVVVGFVLVGHMPPPPPPPPIIRIRRCCNVSLPPLLLLAVFVVDSMQLPVLFLLLEGLLLLLLPLLRVWWRCAVLGLLEELW